MQISTTQALVAQISLPQAAPGGAGALASTRATASSGSSAAVRAADRVSISNFQFDLASVYSARAAVDAQPVIPEAQQQAETKAVSDAFAYIDAGELDSARGLLNAVLAKNPRNAAAVQALGYADMGARAYAAAEKLFQKAHALNPTAGYDNDAANARVLQGDDEAVLARANALARSPSQRGEAVRLLIELSQRSPDDARFKLALGDAMIASGERDDGLLQFSIAVDRADAQGLEALERRVDALIESDDQSAFLRHMKGRIELRSGRHADAIQSLTEAKALSENPLLLDADVARAHVGLGREALKRGDTYEALRLMKRAQELAPARAEVRVGLAEVYVRRAEESAQQGRDDDALQDYVTAQSHLAATRDKPLAARAAAGAFALGRRLEREREQSGGEIEGEVLAYQTAYDLEKTSSEYADKLAQTRHALGDQLTAEGKLKEAAYAYQRAHVLDKYNPTYKQKTIDGFVAWGDERRAAYVYDEAIEAYRTAWEMDLGDVANKSKLAEAYHARGEDLRIQEDFKKAVKDFKEALALFPQNATYQASYELVRGWDY